MSKADLGSSQEHTPSSIHSVGQSLGLAQGLPWDASGTPETGSTLRGTGKEKAQGLVSQWSRQGSCEFRGSHEGHQSSGSRRTHPLL